ncbi:MAG: hypothetical protein JNM18_16150 [Planctomycetaceae bacterium]|nr:hypothetical protein [Planctomycetaceae bacterium]
METKLTVAGRYVGRTFIPDGPLPEGDGTAILVITPTPRPVKQSIAAAFGRASVLRSGDDIMREAQADRAEWGDR